jgi:hypothetical protein
MVAPPSWPLRSPATAHRSPTCHFGWSEYRSNASPMPSDGWPVMTRVDASRVTAMAISRGSEGLLATVSRIDDLPLRSIVAISPSSATWVGLGENGSLSVSRPGRCRATTCQPCKPTIRRCLRRSPDRRSVAAGGGLASARRSLELLRGFAPKLDDPEMIGAAAIESERIGVPLFLVAGGADVVWPSGEMAKRLLARRHQAQATAAANDQRSPIPMPAT